MTIHVVLADDHKLVRQGLRLLLESDPDFKVVGEANNGREAIDMAAQHSPDVVVMDVGMADLNGVDATRQIVTANPRVRVVALSTHNDRRFIMAMLAAGASGYVIKDNAAEELLRAIRAAHAGHKYLSSEVADAVVEKAIAPADQVSDSGPALGGREREVVQLLAEGKSSKEIAAAMNISVNTVEAHRRNIMEKLNLHSVAELTKYAIREGLTSLDK